MLQASSAGTAKLIGQVSDGDMEALAELFEDMRMPIYLLSYSILRSHALAEEAVQEVFVKVMEKASSYQPVGSAKAWMLRIARNTSIDMLRRETRVSQGSEDQALEDEGLGDTEDLVDFLAATRDLSDQDKSIVILKVFADMTHAEVAKVVGMTDGAVRMRYRRILRRLKAFYEQRR